MREGTRQERRVRVAAQAWPLLLPLVSLLLASGIPEQVHALQISDLQSPQSFIADPEAESYFISNVNGEGTARDNNGFITKLDKDGKIVHRHFIQGGAGQTVLHAPKGMAIVKNVLYVADLDVIRGFDTGTGQPMVTVPLSRRREASTADGLADIAHDGQGILYVSDTTTNTIYRVDTSKDHAVSVLANDESLAGPRGLALHPRTGHLIVVSWNKGKILELDEEGQITVIVSNSFFSSRFQNLDGVDFDVWGNMYVSDFTAGKVWRITPNKRFDVIAEYLLTPADISVDRKNHLILVPYLYGNAAEINGLESPIKKKRRPRTLKDYGFPFMTPPKEQPADE